MIFLKNSFCYFLISLSMFVFPTTSFCGETNRTLQVLFSDQETRVTINYEEAGKWRTGKLLESMDKDGNGQVNLSSGNGAFEMGCYRREINNSTSCYFIFAKNLLGNLSMNFPSKGEFCGDLWFEYQDGAEDAERNYGEVYSPLTTYSNPDTGAEFSFSVDYGHLKFCGKKSK